MDLVQVEVLAGLKVLHIEVKEELGSHGHD